MAMHRVFLIIACAAGVNGKPLGKEDPSRTLATILLAHSPTTGRSRVNSANPKASPTGQSISRRATVLAPAVLWPFAASAATDRFLPVGRYTDPQHPGCTRTVKIQGNDVSITGFDEITGPLWTVKGKVGEKSAKDGKLVIDFTPKGGPSGVEAVWVGNGFKFPDGNVWTKLTEKEVMASTALIGAWRDPKLQASGYTIINRDGQILIKGSDGLGADKTWEARGSIIASQIFVDFSARGEKGIVTGNKVKNGIDFSNGLVWKDQSLQSSLR